MMGVQFEGLMWGHSLVSKIHSGKNIGSSEAVVMSLLPRCREISEFINLVGIGHPACPHS